jgi:hypothetical protein
MQYKEGNLKFGLQGAGFSSVMIPILTALLSITSKQRNILLTDKFGELTNMPHVRAFSLPNPPK